VSSALRIVRDQMGIPHIEAGNRPDAYLGLGYVMAEDRLWQLDWHRRCAQGRTAEILGPSHLWRDVEARHVGFWRTATTILGSLPPVTTGILEAFASGINLAMERQYDRLPPEFQLTGHRPEPWLPVDTLAVLNAFWWYLSGRLNWIAAHDVVLRTLPEALAEAFLAPTGDVGSIVDPDATPLFPPTGAGDASGSNNWAISGRHTASGVPLLASDPHVVYSAPSMWYEVQIDCPEEQSAGASYVGVPGFLIGRNRSTAWGFTNNICSNRDLYREKINPADPEQYLDGPGIWRAFDSRQETIVVRGAKPEMLTIRSTSRGPVVNAVIDERVRPAEPVSLVWTGFLPGDEIGVMLRYHMAADVDEFAAALTDWRCPTFNFVFADSQRIGYRCAGDLPLRGRRWLGIRDANDDRDQWDSVVGTPHMPSAMDPASGWIATANNRVSTTHQAVGQSGYWPSSLRFERLRQLIEEGTPHDEDHMRRMQLDIRSLHAARLTPRLLSYVGDADLSAIAGSAIALLRHWDFEFSLDSPAAAVFETFFLRWTERIANERFPARLRAVVAPQGTGLATSLLLDGDERGWFRGRSFAAVVHEVLEAAVHELSARLGPLPEGWQWGQVHRLILPHPLDAEGAARWPFELAPVPMAGGWNTVNNQLYDTNAPFAITIGPSCRMIANLAQPDSLLMANAGGASGDPRSEHYRDAFEEWQQGGYHELWLSGDSLRRGATHTKVLQSGDAETA